MGHGIAQVAATAGYKVTVRDIAQEYLDNGLKGITKSLSRSVERERISQEEMDAVLSRIKFTTDLKEAVADAQLVVEAIPERMEIKHMVWKEVDQYAPKDAILASNTSSLSITEIASVVSNPARFIGMHFFNPPVIMKLIEVNQGEKTSEATVQTIMKLSQKMGKTPVWVKRDAPGFIVNRILITYLNEAAKLLDKYGMEQIDAAMQHKAGMPIDFSDRTKFIIRKPGPLANSKDNFLAVLCLQFIPQYVDSGLARLSGMTNRKQRVFACVVEILDVAEINRAFSLFRQALLLPRELVFDFFVLAILRRSAP